MDQRSIAPKPIQIRLFAGLREAAGWGEHAWPWPPAGQATGSPSPTPDALWQELALPGELSAVRIAINQQFAEADTPLQPGDELAFLPPISGG